MTQAWGRRIVTAAAIAVWGIWMHAAPAQAQDEQPPEEAPPPAVAPPPPAPRPVPPRRPAMSPDPTAPGTYRADDGEVRPLKNPLWGIFMEMGLGGGGDDLVKVTLTDGSTQTLSAGDGVSFALGVMCTPLWVGNDLGVGLSASAGYKYWSVGASNGSISMGRAPLALALHVLPRLSPRWFLFGRGGLQKEVGVHISSSGIASGIDASPQANLGGFGEAGVYAISNTSAQNWAWSLTFRYTKVTYVENGQSANGQSFMLFTTAYFNP